MRWCQYIGGVVYIANASTSRAVDIFDLGYQIECFSALDFWDQSARCT